MTGHSWEDRAFERWLWTVPSPSARREIVAALGVVPMLGPRVVNTRWGRRLGSRLVEVTVRCHRSRGPDPVDLETHVYCRLDERGGVSVQSAWDPIFEPRIGRIQALRSAYELLGRGGVQAASDYATVYMDYAPLCIVATGAACPADRVQQATIRRSTGRPHPAGLSMLVERVRAEARRESADAAKAFAVRCARYRVAVFVSAARRLRGLTQTDLAGIAGVGQPAVARLECARDGVSAETLALVLGALIDDRAGRLSRHR